MKHFFQVYENIKMKKMWGLIRIYQILMVDSVPICKSHRWKQATPLSRVYVSKGAKHVLIHPASRYIFSSWRGLYSVYQYQNFLKMTYI